MVINDFLQGKGLMIGDFCNSINQNLKNENILQIINFYAYNFLFCAKENVLTIKKSFFKKLKRN